jgi:alpha-amylase
MRAGSASLIPSPAWRWSSFSNTPGGDRILSAAQQTGCVEFLDETYYHSLVVPVFPRGIPGPGRAASAKIKQLFGQEPRVFRNTELIYNNDLAHFVSHMGYDAIITEGADHIPGLSQPEFCLPPAARAEAEAAAEKLPAQRRHRVSAFQQSRLGAVAADGRKIRWWVNQINGNGILCNLFMDYETFGEHQWAETGIFDFMRHLPGEVMKKPDNNFSRQPGDRQIRSVGEIDVPHMISWADTERDLSAWLGNAMQSNALHELYKLEGPLKEKGDEQLLTDWRG